MVAELPPFHGASRDALEQTTAERTFLEAGLSDPTLESDGKRWRGVHFLGRGASGRTGMWVRVDDSDHIIEVSCLQIKGRHLYYLVISGLLQETLRQCDQMRGRMQLVEETVCRARLLYKSDSTNTRATIINIHRYFGHRISLHLRRYRLYNEVCDLGDLLHALCLYESEWWVRRGSFR